VTEFEVVRKGTNIVTGSDGQVWVDDDEANQFVQLDKDGKVTGRVDCDSGSSPRAVVAGRGDALFWYTEAQGKKLVKVTKSLEKVSVAYLPFTASALALGANDEVFAAEAGKAIYRIIPDQASPTRWQASPTDVLAVSPGNNVWTSEGVTLAKLVPADGVKHFDLSAPSIADGLCVGPDMGLWFTDGAAHQLGRLEFDGRMSYLINLPTNTGPGRIITGPDKALWFAEVGMLKIGRFQPNREPTHYPLPTPAAPYALTVGPDGNIWFTSANRKVSRLIPDPIVQ